MDRFINDDSKQNFILHGYNVLNPSFCWGRPKSWAETYFQTSQLLQLIKYYIFIELMKIDPVNAHNELGYKTITIHCKNKYVVM